MSRSRVLVWRRGQIGPESDDDGEGDEGDE